MSWLRIDDRFAFHPKVGSLTRADRWTWMEVLCHCAAQRTGGRIPSNITELYRYVTPRFLSKAKTAGLVDVDEDGTLHIHDWEVYNGANLDVRIANYLAENPFASANEVHKEVGGKREIVLALVAEYKQQSQTGGSRSGSQEPKGNQEGTGSGTGTRARVPTPNPSLTPELQELQPPSPNPAVDVDLADPDERDRILRGEGVLHDLNAL